MNAPILPIPRSPVTVRAATPADLPFIDSLQKRHAKQVGWMPTKSLEQKVAAGNLLVAEMQNDECRVQNGEADAPVSSSFSIHHSAFSISPAGYIISTDRYMKREDCGIIYQVNVAPGRQRGLIGAALVRTVFERAAYGCRLFCCWCAQDIAANRFWESLGFVPLAFRAGSREKGRVHIFWQRRVRAGDTTTPYWFPSQTTGGAIREDRLVFPIPPGVGWRDAMPIVLPHESAEAKSAARRALPGSNCRARHSAMRPPRSCISSGGLRIPAPGPFEPEPKPERPPKQKVRNDPRLVAAARELRDRYLEHVNRRELACAGKYDVSRVIEGTTATAATITFPARAPAALPALPAPGRRRLEA